MCFLKSIKKLQDFEEGPQNSMICTEYDEKNCPINFPFNGIYFP